MTALLPASPAACPVTWKIAVPYPTLPLLAWEEGVKFWMPNRRSERNQSAEYASWRNPSYAFWVNDTGNISFSTQIH